MFNVKLSHLSFVTLILVLIICYTEGDDISWNLANKPVAFGNIAYLCCEIPQQDSCNKGVRQWFGSSNYQPLCQNGNCRDRTKYDTMQSVTNQPSMCLYTLMIRNFSESDLNCDYTCSFGVKHERKPLIINSRDFEYIPIKEEVEANISFEASLVVVYVRLRKVYPTPNCYTAFTKEGVKRALTVTTVKNGIFLQADLTGIFVVGDCSETLVVCVTGISNTSIFNKTLDLCSSEEPYLFTAKLTTGLIVGTAMFMWCSILCYVISTSKSKESHRSLNEMKEFALLSKTISVKSNSLPTGQVLREMEDEEHTLLFDANKALH